MVKARIYQPAKTAMQSGRALTRTWRLDFDPMQARFIEPLMGWTGSHETQGQVCLSFPTKEAAIAFAEKHGIVYDIEEPRARRIPRRAYAENFSYNRQR